MITTTNPTPARYSVAQIAARAGVSPQAICKRMAGIDPDAYLDVAHAAKPVPAWYLSSLPRALRDELAARARVSGFRSAEDYLADTRKPFQPDVSLRDCVAGDIDFAARLQRALVPFCVGEFPDLSAAEFRAHGVEAHRLAFNLETGISERHWWRLYRMVVDRDHGAGDFNRLEIFLPLRQTAKGAKPAARENAPDEAFGDVAAVIAGCVNACQPTKIEWEVIRRRAMQALDFLLTSGCTTKQAMRLAGGFLSRQAPFTRLTREAIRCRLTRWRAEWITNPGESNVVLDRRGKNTGNRDGYTFPEADWEMLVGVAAWQHDGDVATAWRELWQGKKFSPETLQHFSQWTRARKSDVPRSVMDSVRGVVDVLKVWRLGRRGYNSLRPTVRIADTPIPPMMIISADDLTPDCYYGVEIAPGRDRMVRGQILLFIDVGTTRIIGSVISPAPNYNALMIAGEMGRICREICVPAGVAFEKGIWERAALVKGRSKGKAGLSPTEREGRFERMGIKFLHSISPQGKARMERTIGAIQRLFRAEPGACGNDEKVTCPEETRRMIDRVNKGELRAKAAGFHDYESFCARFTEICAHYNAEPQEGKTLKGKRLKGLSPDAAWSEFQQPDYIPTKFTPELEFMLAEHVEEVTVGKNGIRLPHGKGIYYKMDGLFNWIGKPVKVRLNVEAWGRDGLPDEVVFSDEFEERFYTARLDQEVNPALWLLDPECDDLRKARRQNAGMEAPLKELLKKLRPQFSTLKQPVELRTRRTIAGGDTHRKGGAIASAKAASIGNRRKDDAGKLAGVLGGMDASEIHRLTTAGQKIEDARKKMSPRSAVTSFDYTEEERQRARDAIARHKRENAHLFEGMDEGETARQVNVGRKINATRKRAAEEAAAKREQTEEERKAELVRMAEETSRFERDNLHIFFG